MACISMPSRYLDGRYTFSLTTKYIPISEWCASPSVGIKRIQKMDPLRAFATLGRAAKSGSNHEWQTCGQFAPLCNQPWARLAHYERTGLEWRFVHCFLTFLFSLPHVIQFSNTQICFASKTCFNSLYQEAMITGMYFLHIFSFILFYTLQYSPSSIPALRRVCVYSWVSDEQTIIHNSLP